jgi:hypothetical protein
LLKLLESMIEVAKLHDGIVRALREVDQGPTWTRVSATHRHTRVRVRGGNGIVVTIQSPPAV